MNKKIFFFISAAIAGILMTPDQAFAWGAGIHITHGIYILEHLSLIAPNIAQLLKAFPHDYLYGCISADIFIGKGIKKRLDHCHNWRIGQKMLSMADTDHTTAFVYGYLSHLAADIISHNFYVPNQLYITSSTKRFGHIYWEFRSDEFVNKKIWKIAKMVIERHNLHNDAFLQEVVKKKLVPFKIKKRFFSHSIKLNDLAIWQKTIVLVSKKSRWNVDRNYIEELNRHSLNLIINYLKSGKKSICLKYDPVGSDTLNSAKKKRRAARTKKGSNPEQVLFKIPSEIENLSYVSDRGELNPLCGIKTLH